MTDTVENSSITAAFEAHDIDCKAFGHVEHVRVAFDLLRKYDFIDASAIYAKGIRTIASNAGAPRKFNLTITYAFMSLIAERSSVDPDGDFESFVTGNPDLMSGNVLTRWYDAERLHTDTARRIFLLPDACMGPR